MYFASETRKGRRHGGSCFLPIMLAFAVVSCGGDDSKTKADGSDAGSSTPTGAKLTGTWISECYQGINGFNLRTYVFTATELTLTIDTYATAGCETAAKTLTVVWTGVYALGPFVSEPAGATQFDFTYQTTNITPASEEAAAGLNQIPFCGKTDWVAGTTADLSTQGCASIGSVKTGDVNYGVLKLAEDEQAFQVGLLPASKPENRPTTLLVPAMTKQ